jgi:hypothetical protein
MPGTLLAHCWTLHALEPPSQAEAEAALREPAAAVPATLAARLGPLRLYAVPYLTCSGDNFFVAWDPLEGESHSSIWLEQPDGIHLFLSFSDTNPHDAGFELLAALGELMASRLSSREFADYGRLLAGEIAEGVTGEIDEDAFAARQSASPDYPSISLASTLAEYLHALWHDVEVRSGPQHLRPPYIRRRFEMLAQWFPPNPGYRLFR